MHNNDKKWLVNFLTGRQAQVINHNSKSKFRILTNGVPQGSVLSPSLFNLFLHDLSNPTSNITTLIYADDLAITSQHPKTKLAVNTLQQYIHTLERWLTENKMSASPTKSTLTLFTPDRHEPQTHPRVTLFN